MPSTRNTALNKNSRFCPQGADILVLLAPNPLFDNLRLSFHSPWSEPQPTKREDSTEVRDSIKITTMGITATLRILWGR